ncbi:genome sequencing data contig C319 [Clostridium sp. CAG:729]|nr:genome sequencing data contig C319 [Clostridium sp. CAG:729]
MFEGAFTLSNFYMIAGFLLSMYACVSNDIIQTLGTFLSANKKTPFYYLWAFSVIVLVITIVTGWIVNNGDMSFGLLTRIPVTEHYTFLYLLPPIILILLTRWGIPVATTFLVLSVFSVSDTSVIWMMLTKSVLGYVIAFVAAIIIYNIIGRPLERYFYYTQKRSGDTKISKWWMVAKWCSTAFIWSQWLVQDSAKLFVYLPRKASVTELLFVLLSFTVFLGILTYKRGGDIQKIVKMKTNVQDPRSATIIDIIYAFLLLYFINLNNVPMSTTWVFIGLLAGREIALYQRLRFESPKKMYKHIIKDLYKVTLGLIVSVVVVVLLTQFDYVKHFFFSHFIGG